MTQMPVQIGPYQVVREIGRGGMGVVYLARDARLDRDVAIKALPEDLAADPDRLARFEREAKTLAQLSHQNIAGIYGVEKHDGAQYLVLEYVEGETLAQRLDRGPLPIDEALEIAVQIAAGVEAAHEAGVIHRDLKPGNVIVTPDGKAKVLDFGLARAEDGSSSRLSMSPDSPTITRSPAQYSPTMPGVILGTAAYMSPEQARARSTDKRTDIWSFGVILYEMLTGASPFIGETVGDSIGAVLHKDIAFDHLPRATPHLVRHVLTRCLVRDKSMRLRDIGDARLELLGAATEPVDERVATGLAHPRHRWHVPVSAALALIGLSLASWSLLRPSAVTEPVHLSIVLGDDEELTGPPAISRDGRTIAYTAKRGSSPPRLFVRDLAESEPRAVPGSDDAARPFFSPDGRSVGFFAQGELRVVSVSGGRPRFLAPAPTPFGGTWSDDGTIVFTATLNSGLLAIPADGGEPETLTTPDFDAGSYAHTWPQFLPGDEELLFSIWPDSKFGVAVLSMDDRTWRIVLPGSSGARYAETGHLLVPWDADVDGDLGALRVAPFHPRQSAEAKLRDSVLHGVYSTPWSVRNWFSVSATGTLAYVPGNVSDRTLVWIDDDGKVEVAYDEQAPFVHLALSPDGTRVAYKAGFGLWVRDFRNGTRVRLTDPEDDDSALPVWNHDGSKIYFTSNRAGNWDIFVRSADGSGPIESVLARPGWQAPLGITSDGTLLINSRTQETGWDLATLSPDGTLKPLLDSPANEFEAAISPDGKWMAYSSNDSGRDEVYVKLFAEPGARTAVSTEGGNAPLWSEDGRTLFYMSGDAVMAATIDLESGFSITQRRRLFEGKFHAPFVSPWGRAPDGRFLLIRREPGSIPDRIDVVINWARRLEDIR